MTKEIELTQGKVALVDDEDYSRLTVGYSWHVRKRLRGGMMYAECSYRVSMHNMVLRTKGIVIHMNGNGLDNRKSNLKIGGRRESARHKGKKSGTSSDYKGVTWHTRKDRWVAHIYTNGKQMHLGYFNVEKEAALAYNEAASRLFGEFARLNEIC